MSNSTIENVYTRHAAKELTRKHFWKLLGMLLTVVVITYAVMFGCAALASGLVSTSEALAVVLGLVAILVTYLVASGLGLGMTSAMLSICRDGQFVKVSHVFSRMGQCLKAFGLMLWVGLKTMLWALPGYALIGFVGFGIAVSGDPHNAQLTEVTEQATLIILPLLAMLIIFTLVIPAALRYMLSTYILADKPETSVFDCVRQSKAMMKGHKWQAFKLAVPLLLLMLLAEFFMALGYSLLVALLGETALAVSASVVLLIGWIVLNLYFSIRLSLGYCIFYIKRCKEQEAAEPEPSPAE